MLIDPRNQSVKENYKLLIGSIVPRPIAFVSTVSKDGIYNVAPYSFFTAVSSKPPTIAFSPSRRSSDGTTKDTYNNIMQSGEFVINIVTEDIIEAVNNSASEFSPDIDEFKEIGLTPIPAEMVQAPLVKESPVQFECKLHKIVDVGPDGPGGGALIIGEIILFHVEDKILESGRIDIEKLNPIGRLAGMEYTKIGEKFSLIRK